MQAYYRILGIDNGEVSTGSTDGNDRGDKSVKKAAKWYKGSGGHHEEISVESVLDRNYYDSSNNSSSTLVHPRILIYTN